MATFAVAALVVAVLFADRLGPPEELKRRFFQVGLAVAIVLLLSSIAAVIVPVPEELGEFPDISSVDADSNGLVRERLLIVVGGALLLLLGSLYRSKMFPTISVGVMLGSLIVIVGAVVDTGTIGYLSFYYELALDSDEVRNAAYAAMVGLGVVLLLLYGYNEWDRALVGEAEGEALE